MKNVNYVINGVLAVAVIILFIMQFSGKQGVLPSSGHSATASDDFTASMPVAYIDIDTLVEKYYFSIDLREQILKKQEDMRAVISQQARKLQADYESFQYKLKNGAFATQQRAEQEQERLQKQNQELEDLDQRLSMNLIEETRQVHMQLRDTIISYLNEYNRDKNFQIIFSNTSNFDLVTPNPVLLANKPYNITNEVVEYLNKRWTAPR
ncbi:MAG: OmpH family outer membrane protein [Tannerella sp.]|jgi:outer membrane protein|nr:OmpH family outer membrane protein [Tannerella sp.]